MRKHKKMLMTLCAATFATALAAAAVSVRSVTAEDVCGLTMRAGASVRIGDTQAGTGIRFTADVDESLLNVAGDVATFKTDDAVAEVGMIIVPAAVLKNVGSSDVFTYVQTTFGATKAEISTQFTDAQIQKDKDGFYVAGAIVQLQDENLGLDYQAVPYTYDGENYVYGVKSDVRSISYVFNAALASQTEKGLAEKPKVLAKAVEMGDKLDLVAEGEIASGLDLANYVSDDYVIESAKFTASESAETVADNAIDFDGAYNKAGLGKELVITYENEKTLTISADVWSLYIKTPADLVSNMKATAYSVGNNVYGYYKLTQDLEMSTSNPVNNAPVTQNTITMGGFQGVFDGNGKTIDGLFLKGRSLFGVFGRNAIVKNVNFANVTYNSGYVDSAYNQTAILGSWVYGGTVENVSVTYTIPDKYTTNGATPTLCGLFFGQVYPGGWDICTSINLRNVSITALNAETYTNTQFAPFGYIGNGIGTNPVFNATNVTVIGGAGIYYDATTTTMIKEYDGITYRTGKATVLTAVETQIGETVDFATIVPAGKTVQTVSYNGAPIDGTSVTFSNKSDASDVARTYTIVTTDGEKYSVDVTVWTLILKKNTDFAKLSENVYVEKVYYSDNVNWSNAYYGYYKLGNNIDMVGGTTDRISAPLAASAGTSWNSADGKCYTGTNWGFQGVFDGDGHTVDGMDVYHHSIFGVVGKNAVIKNVNFTNVEYPDDVNAAGQRALFASWMLGGTIQDVTVTYKVPSVLKSTGINGVLFGDAYTYGNSGIFGSQITLTNVTVTALNATTTEYAAFGHVRQYDSNAFKATNVKVYNCPSYYNAKTKAMVYSEGTGITYGTVATN